MEELSVLIAPDSFKGSASSREVGELLEQGVRRIAPEACVRRLLIADGGEGTVDAIVSARGGEIREATVSGPLGEPVCARYGIVDETTAVIEMAEAAGITLIDQTSGNALRASSLGVGQVILDAIGAGARRVLVGLGGSATSDGGVGMAKALGVRFLDFAGDPVPCGLAGLEHLASIDFSGLAPEVRDVEFVALTDVSNPLCGPAGAVYVYGPQKGIGASDLERYDGWMRAYARLLACELGYDVASVSGAGAAGGLGAGLLAFCGARMERGIEYVLDAIGLEDAMEGVDLVLTGEGRMDAQSAFGKAPVGVARRAKCHGIPVVAVVGSRADDLGGVYEAGIDLVMPCVTAPCSLSDCVARVQTSVPIAGESAVRAFLLGRHVVSGANAACEAVGVIA